MFPAIDCSEEIATDIKYELKLYNQIWSRRHWRANHNKLQLFYSKVSIWQSPDSFCLVIASIFILWFSRNYFITQRLSECFVTSLTNFRSSPMKKCSKFIYTIFLSATKNKIKIKVTLVFYNQIH